MKPAPAFDTPRVRIKSWLRTAFVAVFSVTGIAFLWHSLFARHGVRILAYHGVESPPSNPFAVSVEDFEKQIAYITKHFEVIDFDTFLKWKQGEYESPNPKVVLTFDDGFKNNLSHAAPILEKYGAAATFFVIGSKLDGDDQRFMTKNEARELAHTVLFRVGSHSLNHLSVARVSDEQRNEEIGTSKSVLDVKLDREVSLFCYPYGTFKDFDERCVTLLREHGYALACTSVNGINFKGTDPFRLRRTKVEWSDTEKTFCRLLNGGIDGWFLVDYFLRFLQRPRAVEFTGDRESAPKSV